MSELGQQLISIVRQKAAETPEFVYGAPDDVRACVYVRDGKPSCLIGQALWGAGVIDCSISRHDNADVFSVLADRWRLGIDVAEVSWLRKVQRRQDDGVAWGSAVAQADGAFGTCATRS